jgi:hypothetical protein
MGGHTFGREPQYSALRLILAAAFAALPLALSANAPAQESGRFPGVLPKASIVSDETSPAGEPEARVDEGVPPSETESPPTPYSHPRHYAAGSESPHSGVVEPTHAMLKLKEDSWAYAGPDTSSTRLEQVHAGKFVNVTGSTHYFAEVKLKSGATGYVPLSAVELARPQDKIVRLSTNAAVLSLPNRYGKKLSQVHEGHDVHVVGVSMNYIKIRMKSGLEGYIPMTATE